MKPFSITAWMTSLSIIGAGALAACDLQQPSAVSPSPSPPPSLGSSTALELEAHGALLEPGVVTYSLLVFNPGNEAVGGITLEVRGVGGAESLFGPDGTEVRATDEGLSWTIPSVPARVRLGPFSLRAPASSSGESLQATLSWLSPHAGQASIQVGLIEDATQREATVVMQAGPLSEIAGTGVRYFVPLGSLGTVSLTRLSEEPFGGANSDLIWIAGYEVTKESPGPLAMVIPLERPAPPFSSVRVFVDEGRGLGEQQVMGTVTGDGLHAAFTAEASSRYVLGVPAGELSLSSRDVRDQAARGFDDLVELGLIDVDSILGEIDSLTNLINSLGTDGIVVIGGDDGWYVIDTPTGDSDPDECESDDFGITCYNASQEGGTPCENHGGGVTNVNFDTGASESYCADGTTITECEDMDNDGYCANVDSDDNNDAVHFAPVPGPCPHGVCFTDTTTGEIVSMDLLEGLAPMIDAMIEMAGLSRTTRLEQPPLSSSYAYLGDASLGAGLRALVGVIENNIVMVIPHGQAIDVSLAIPPAVPVVAATPTGQPTATASATRTALPPTATRTPTPILDTIGPSFKSVSDSPDPIYVNQPAGCSPSASVVSVSVSDPSGVASVVVLFFHTTIGAVPMTHTGGNNWQATLGPYTGVGDGTVDYQIRATDSQGNITDSAFYQVTVLACIP